MGRATEFLELDSHHDGGRNPISIPLPLVPEPRATPHMFLHGARNRGNLNMTLPHHGFQSMLYFAEDKCHWKFVLA